MKKNTSKLVRKVITDKKGHRRTVWVKPIKNDSVKRSKKVDSAGIRSAVVKWAENITKHKAKEYPNQYGKDGFRHFIVVSGKKYHKVIEAMKGEDSGSVFAFVDKETGNIFKPKSFASPAQGVRANIFKKPPLNQGSLYR